MQGFLHSNSIHAVVVIMLVLPDGLIPRLRVQGQRCGVVGADFEAQRVHAADSGLFLRIKQQPFAKATAAHRRVHHQRVQPRGDAAASSQSQRIAKQALPITANAQSLIRLLEVMTKLADAQAIPDKLRFQPQQLGQISQYGGAQQEG